MDSTQKLSTSRFYESAVAGGVLDYTLHPGGESLTASAARAAGVTHNSLVLDVACGTGVSDRFIAQEHGCRVVGIDLSERFLELAKQHAGSNGCTVHPSYVRGDAEKLPFRDSIFDAVIVECAFSLMPNKGYAAGEYWRVLRPGGNLTITDVTLRGQLSEELRTGATLCSCLADAESVEGYLRILHAAGFISPYVEEHDREFKQMMFRIVYRYGTVDSFCQALNHSGADTDNEIVSQADTWRALFREGKPSYVLISVKKPDQA